jgi:hypothetical protein
MVCCSHLRTARGQLDKLKFAGIGFGVIPLALGHALTSDTCPKATISQVLAPDAVDLVQVAVDTPYSTTAVFENAVPWDEFIANAPFHWGDIWREARARQDLVQQARHIPGRWRLLVITEVGCFDSMHTIPFLGRLVQQMPSLEMKIVDRAAGVTLLHAVGVPQESRVATPTVLLLDDRYRIRACWVEHPVALGSVLETTTGAGGATNMAVKTAWYSTDAGRSILTEFVDIWSRVASSDVVACDLFTG